LQSLLGRNSGCISDTDSNREFEQLTFTCSTSGISGRADPANLPCQTVCAVNFEKGNGYKPNKGLFGTIGANSEIETSVNEHKESKSSEGHTNRTLMNFDSTVSLTFLDSSESSESSKSSGNLPKVSAVF
jgi:hypothetical protein